MRRRLGVSPDAGRIERPGEDHFVDVRMPEKSIVSDELRT